MRYLLLFMLFMLLLVTVPCRGEGISTDKTIYASASSTVADITVLSDGDGTSEALPIDAYIPINSDGDLRLKHYYNQTLTASMPDCFNLHDVTHNNIENAYIGIAFTSTLTTTPFIYVASKRDGTYKIINIGSTKTSISPTPLTVPGSSFTTYFKLLSATSSTGPTIMIPNATDFEDSNFIYIFTSTKEFTESEAADPATYTGGLYFRLNFSNKYPSPAPIITEILNGDTSVSISFDATAVTNLGTRIYKTLFFQFPIALGCGIHCGGSFSLGQIRTDLGSTVYDTQCIITQKDAVTSGKDRLFGLLNNTTYWFSVSMMNKYNFTSDISVAETSTPEEIEVFLDKQSCYLLSAGFGHEHWILDYFRNFRDNTLAKTQTGRSLIQTYYHFSKPITPYIYNHAMIAWTVRQFAYALWFIFAYPFVVLGSIAAMIGFSFFRRRTAL